MEIRTLKDIPEIKGKRVLLRVDFNVPIKDGRIQDDTRITEALDTIKYLKEHGARLIIMTHLGRPDGQVKDELRLNLIAKHLEKLMGCSVHKMDEIIGKNVEDAVGKLAEGELMMLENVRFDKGEEECDKEFTKKLASLGGIFVNDAFGTAHRKHASTAGLADYLPAYGGFLMEREMKALMPLVSSEPEHPFTMIFGGAKIDTKIGIIKNFIKKADYFLIGGGIANTFLYAAGYNMGASLYEKNKKELAQEIMLDCEEHKERFVLPKDLIVADEIAENSQTTDMPVEDIEGGMKAADLGEKSINHFREIIKKSKTVIWNGPVGVYEFTPFITGTKAIAECLANHKCTSIIGGGDTSDAIKKFGIDPKKFTHISTGGGACIEFLEGKALPGIEILIKK